MLTGGERLDVAGRPVRVAYTPGHAVHHVSYLDEGDGIAYVGDTCGIRIAGDYLVAAAAARYRRRGVAGQPGCARRLAAGDAVPDPLRPGDAGRAHLAAYRSALERTAERVAVTLDGEATDEARAASFAALMREEARRHLPAAEVAALELAAPFDQIWAGLARYWRKRAGGTARP